MKKSNIFLKKAGVSLITLILIFTSIVVTADTVKQDINLQNQKTTYPNISNGGNVETKGSVMFSQLPFEPDEDFEFYVSDNESDLRVHDDFWGITKDICYITFWGFCLRWINDDWEELSNPEDLQLEIIIWDSLLGNPICIYQKSPEVYDTNRYYDGFKLYLFHIEFNPCCSCGPNGLISIQSIYHPDDGKFIWIGSNDGNLYAYQEGNPDEPEKDTDVAFNLFSGGVCRDLIVEKYVWNPTEQVWVDADTEEEAFRLPIGEEIQFKITIKNIGSCLIEEIHVWDNMTDSLKFISCDPEPDNYTYLDSFHYLDWFFPGPMNPGMSIDLNVTASVEGPEGDQAYNYVYVQDSDMTFFDDDFAYVNAYKKSRNVNTQFLNFLQHFLQQYLNLFPTLRQLLGLI